VNVSTEKEEGKGNRMRKVLGMGKANHSSSSLKPGGQRSRLCSFIGIIVEATLAIFLPQNVTLSKNLFRKPTLLGRLLLNGGEKS